MMDPALKTALGICILLGGVCTAWMFRHERSQVAPTEPDRSEQILLRYRAEVANRRGRDARRSAKTLPDSPSSSDNPQPATVVPALERHEPPPSLAPAYPQSERAPSSRWGVSMEMMLPVAATADDAAHTHRIVDGDTLAALAQRYLGSADRAGEIYEANRDVLHDPDLLPIGVELKLPPRTRGRKTTTGPAAGSPLRKPLAPVSHAP